MPPRHFTLLLLAGAALALAPVPTALAAPLPETLLWDAAAAGADPSNTWASAVGSHDWSVSGATHGTATSGHPGITHAYSFDGVNDRIFGSSLHDFGGTTQNTSIEAWFRPTSLGGGQQVIFETGGRIDGLAITLDDSNLLFRVQDDSTNVVSLLFDLSSDPFLVDPLEFIHIVASVDLDDTAELFVNGTSVATGSAAGINDWAGSGGAGVGDVNGRVGGTNGPGEGDLFGYGNFAGEIAMLRYYQDQILTPSEVTQNFDAVASAPEPATGLLFGMGLMLLAWRRRR